jgi:thymidylate synthase (FAD)
MPGTKTVEKIVMDRIAVLDHGFMELQDYMGSDADIVSAARASYTNGTTITSDERSLLRYLYRHKHTSPFEMCEVRLRIRAPIFVIRQWVRHRTHNMNEESARYSVIKDLYHVPDIDDIQPQSQTNKQGRAGELGLDLRSLAQDVIQAKSQESFSAYTDLLGMGVARETAREVLPLNTYSTFVWKMDLKNFLHLLTLRIDSHTQKETRAYAEALYVILKALFPVTVEAWEDYTRDAVTFSRMEMKALLDVLGAFFLMPDNTLDSDYGLEGRELAEFKAKLRLQ